MNDLVSIIMPSYNTAEYIGASIASVLRQTYRNWELIIVDDCSTDATDDAVAAVRDSRIRYYRNETNCGAACSRNRALREAKGRWIAFLDSDDLWVPEKLEKQIAFMERNGYAFSYTCHDVIDEKGNPLDIVISGPKCVSHIGMTCYCWVDCLTVMYDANVIGLIQIENIRKNNDYAMWLQVSRRADCYLLNENLAHYRKRGGSISNRSWVSMVRWHYRLFREAERRNPVSSFFHTGVNLICGFCKKIIYTSK